MSKIVIKFFKENVPNNTKNFFNQLSGSLFEIYYEMFKYYHSTRNY